MQKLHLLFELSPWFILICLLAGAGYAFLLYKKPNRWEPVTNYTLAGFRFTMVSLLCLLLLGPFVKLIQNKIEQPTYVFAIDNSSSIAEMSGKELLGQLNTNLRRTAEDLKDKGFNVAFRTFSGAIPELKDDSIAFNHHHTDLQGLLKSIQSDYEGKNIGGVILVSDGIYNQGISPTYLPHNFAIHTIGMGDTIPKKDINLKTLYHNKIAYQGNKFLLVAEVSNIGFAGQEVKVVVRHQNKILATKTFTPQSGNEINELEFIIEPKENGMQHYIVEAMVKEGEFTVKNNVKHAYVDIIEGKEKILMVALSPHPDIKAIRKALELNQNYEFHLHIPGVNTFKDDKYDLIIFHQLPDNNQRVFSQFKKYLDQGTSAWYILGNQSNLDQFNAQNPLVKVNVIRGEKDNVFPVYNEAFHKFKYNDDLRQVLKDYPPVKVPFGRIDLSPEAEVLLFQKVGSIGTNKPLLIVGERENKKTAVMLGEGMWQWRLQEYSRNENYAAFDEMVGKLVQFLSAKDDKRKFKVYPVKNEFVDTESVVFEAEIYNEIYEKTYDQQVSILVTSENGEKKQYQYVPNENNTQYKISGLPQGIYKYTANSTVNGKKETASGQFTVKEQNLESLNLTANHQLLRKLSAQTNARFYSPDQFDQLRAYLKEHKAKGIIYSEEDLMPFIQLPWLMVIILLLASMEWFIRKYNGGY